MLVVVDDYDEKFLRDRCLQCSGHEDAELEALTDPAYHTLLNAVSDRISFHEIHHHAISGMRVNLVAFRLINKPITYCVVANGWKSALEEVSEQLDVLLSTSVVRAPGT